MKIKRCFCITAFVEQGKFAEVETFWRDVMGAEIGPEMPWLLKYGHHAKNTRIPGTEGAFSVEIAECHDENLPIGKQAKKYAPCYYVLTYQVANMDEAITEMRAKGIKVSDKQEMTYPGFEVEGKKNTLYECMIHPKSSYGLTIEMAQFDKAPAWYGLD